MLPSLVDRYDLGLIIARMRRRKAGNLFLQEWRAQRTPQPEPVSAMAEAKPNKFFIGIAKDGQIPIGHTVSIGKPALFEELKSEEQHPQGQESTKTIARALDDAFADTFRKFVDSMESYRKFISLTLLMAPFLSTAIQSREIQKFATSKGVARPDISSKTTTIYELDIACFREYQLRETIIRSASAGADQLPQIMIIGLVSAYDAFLAHLLKAVFALHPEAILTSEKEIAFSDLIKFSTIDDARNSIVDREIDSVLRMGHDDQFAWMEKKFSMQLRSDLPVWPHFVELCERRNLLTHTGGTVTAQYIQSGRDHKFDVSTLVIGARLEVTPDYFKRAVSIMYEIGIKLCSVFWRKFAKEEREEADRMLNELAFNLISDGAYDLAETFLTFGTVTLKKHASESTRRMMVVNRANAIRLQNRKEEAVKLLDEEDWSASSKDFVMCVAAVKEDMHTVLTLMREFGSAGPISKEHYRTWPVFRGLHSNDKFLAQFEAIFNEPLNSPKAVGIEKGAKVPDQGELTNQTKLDAAEAGRTLLAEELEQTTPSPRDA